MAEKLTVEEKMPKVQKQIPFQTEIDGIRVMGTYCHETFRKSLHYIPNKDDVFIATFPKSGTTWAQQIVFLIYNNGLPTEDPMVFFTRMPYLELCGVEACQQMPPGGAIKTHLPFHVAPFVSNAKYLYIVRNPKDVLVSFFHHVRNVIYKFEEGEFDDYFEIFMNGENDYGDYFDHVLGWYDHRNDDNVLFLKYEEMKHDERSSILKIAHFLDEELGKKLERDNTMLNNVLKYSNIEYMKTTYNESMDDLFNDINQDKLEEITPELKGLKYSLKISADTEREYRLRKHLEGETPTDKKFRMVRKGIVGDWRNLFSENQNRRMNIKIESKLGETELYSYWKEFGYI